MSMDAPGYEQLAAVLQAAYDQAAAGKGAERHADGKPFHEQPMQTGSDMLGTDAGLAFQAIKKIREGSTFAEFDRFERELLGAINYIAGMVIWRRRQLPRAADHPRVAELHGEITQLLVEDAPKTFSERCAEIDAGIQDAVRKSLAPENQQVVPVGTAPTTGEGMYAHFAARCDRRVVGMNPALGAGYELTARCDECEYPDDGTGTHYAACSKLTAPKEFVEQVEATFDELENPEPDVVCQHCGSREGAFHHADCHLMRKGKLHLAKELTDLVVGRESPEFLGAAAEVITVDECSAEDPFTGAPEWAKYKLQICDGRWFWFEFKPDITPPWDWPAGGCRVDEVTTDDDDPRSNPNWRDTLIERT